MKTCKDCIHYDICLGAFGDWLPKICDSFKDKSRFIELPCSVGDYGVWKDREWYVNVIEWDGEEFVVWMSDAHIQSCCIEVPINEVRFMTEEEVDKMFERINTERERLYGQI